MFDLLTYEKGCAVLRMLEQYIGPEVFRHGVRTYLKAHAYPTRHTDLWDALEEASGEPVRDVMNTFILQAATPGLAARRDARTATLRLRPVPTVSNRPSARPERPVAVRTLPLDGSQPAPATKLVLGTTRSVSTNPPRA